MKKNLQQEIERTLAYLGQPETIQARPEFIDLVSEKFSHIHHRPARRRNRLAFPAAIIILAFLNVTLFIAISNTRSSVNSEQDQTAVIAGEYGFEQINVTPLLE